MTWRDWVYTKLTTDPTLTALIPAICVFAGGALTSAPPQDQFVIYRMNNVDPRIAGDDTAQAVADTCEVWVYDKPGSYKAIEAYHEALRTELSGDAPTVTGGYMARWMGVSGELADDELKRAVKVANFQLMRSV